LGNPSTPPSLWNLFRENNLSGISRNRAGGIILPLEGSAVWASLERFALKRRQSNPPLQMGGKRKPILNEGDGSSLKSYE